MVREVHAPRKLNIHEETGVDRTSSGQVSKLISDLEVNMNTTTEPIRPVRAYPPPGGVPITETVYYEESTTHEVRPKNVQSLPLRAVAEPMRSPKTASNATRELDDLMTSLSDFKMREPTRIEPVRRAASPKPVPLDSMLGSLQSDMNRQGAEVIPKGHCYYCQKPIVGQVVTALGKTWHMEHFTCVHCGTELGTKSFFERDGEPYCETDYHELFSPRCNYCSAPILDVSLPLYRSVTFRVIFPLEMRFSTR